MAMVNLAPGLNNHYIRVSQDGMVTFDVDVAGIVTSMVWFTPNKNTGEQPHDFVLRVLQANDKERYYHHVDNGGYFIEMHDNAVTFSQHGQFYSFTLTLPNTEEYPSVKAIIECIQQAKKEMENV